MPSRSLIAMLVLTAGGLATGAAAEPLYAAHGYARPVLDGAYVGAPLTRVPRPNEIVPPAWGYGTFGVATVAGIRPTPTAEPALYVIEARRSSALKRQAVPRDRLSGRARTESLGPGSGARVIPVRLPSTR